MASQLVKPARKDTYLYIFGKMMKDVIISNRCTLCGGCVAACPINCIAIKNNKPMLVSICHRCGICYTHCPRTGLNFDEVEKGVFGRIRAEEEKIGVIRSFAVARAKDRKLRKIGQDGGVITALLKFALDKGYIQGAITTKRKTPNSWEPEPTFSTAADIQDTAGSVFSVSSSNQLLGKIYYDYADFVGCNICLSSTALVGTPCQIESFRKMQFSEHGHLKISDIVKFTVSIFCWGNYYYEKFSEFMQSKGIDLSKIDNLAIKNGVFRGFTGNKEVFNFKISELNSIKMPACSECTDLTGELSDISVGGQGAEEGWSFVILRSEFGESLFKEAVSEGYIQTKPLSVAEQGLKEVIKSAENKRSIGRKNIEASENQLAKISHKF
ncbi:MAG: Coenzyme F420 hydrogenase/dehydrogenase, beta subunit C-terminal domain [Candidatus Odinarchaeia archaeon]